MNKEYLYHGSPVKVDKLVPNQAYDTIGYFGFLPVTLSRPTRARRSVVPLG